MEFIKMHGTGNDFIFLLDLNNEYVGQESNLAKKLCHRRFGIGADGIVLVRKSDIADVRMVIVNSDGSAANMCGNAIRCFGKYVFENKDVFVKPFVDVFTKNNIKKVIFFGSGTSYNVSILGTYYFKHLVGIDAEYQYPTVFKNYEKADWSGLLKKDEILYVGISQSGTSISTCEVMKYAKQEGYHTLAITGNLNSEITKYVDTKVHLLVGDELTPPETKGYTTSVISVYLWAVECAHVTGKMSDAEYEKAFDDTKKFINQIQTAVYEQS